MTDYQNEQLQICLVDLPRSKQLKKFRLILLGNQLKAQIHSLSSQDHWCQSPGTVVILSQATPGDGIRLKTLLQVAECTGQSQPWQRSGSFHHHAEIVGTRASALASPFFSLGMPLADGSAAGHERLFRWQPLQDTRILTSKRGLTDLMNTVRFWAWLDQRTIQRFNATASAMQLAPSSLNPVKIYLATDGIREYFHVEQAAPQTYDTEALEKKFGPPEEGECLGSRQSTGMQQRLFYCRQNLDAASDADREALAGVTIVVNSAWEGRMVMPIGRVG